MNMKEQHQRSLADIFLGAYRYCWQVTVNGKPVGYLCEDYEMFRDLILGTEMPRGAIVKVIQVYRRYKPPRHRVTSLFNSKGERKRIPTPKKQSVAHRTSRPHRKKRRWHWGGRGRRH